MTVSQKIAAGTYTNHLPAPVGFIVDVKLPAWEQENLRIHRQFKAEVLAELGLTDHPKAELLWEMALECSSREAMSSGLFDVLPHAQELAKLLK